MNKSKKNKTTPEDQLVNFTDNILSENTVELDATPFAPDPKLRDLQHTALRLKNAFREDGPSEEVIQRMRKNIVTQWQQESKKSKPFWEKWLNLLQPSNQGWQSQRRRQRISMFSYAAVVLGVFLISIFLLNGAYSDQPAATGHNLGAGFLVAFIGAIVLAILFFRSKK